MNDETQIEPTEAAPDVEVMQPQDDQALAVSDQQVDDLSGPAPVELSWQASEYIQHHKTALWYVVTGGIFAVFAIIVAFLHYWLGVGVFVVMGVAVLVYAHRPPRMLTYELSADGLHIDGRLFPFHTFRSFAVHPDVAWHSIDLEPTQRFMPRLSVLFNDSDLDPIVGHLTDYLPRVDRQPDMVERLTRYLRF